MGKNNDQIVGNVYETYDYEKFKIMPENRGRKETKGLNERKLTTLQHMIDNGTWIEDMENVRVNSVFEIVAGTHTFEVLKRNGKPIRYQVTTDPHFNEVTKRDLIGAMYNVNTVTTSWTSSELFNAAIQCKAPLAVLMQEIIEDHDNFFQWTDLMGLLQRDSSYFIGRWRKTNMGTFEDKALLEQAREPAFEAEVKSFAKLNLKVRISARRGLIIKAAYDILWHAREHVNPSLFRKSLAMMPEQLVTSSRANDNDGCRRMLIQHYNKSQGQEVETASVIFALKKKGVEEPVLEL